MAVRAVEGERERACVASSGEAEGQADASFQTAGGESQ